MYDPKFEKAIQQKMEELEFRPPESVWVNIEKAVVVKRRRRIGVIWRFLLAGVFVAAAVGIYGHYTGEKTDKTVAEPSTAAGQTTVAGQTAAAGHPAAGAGIHTPAGQAGATANGSAASQPSTTGRPISNHPADDGNHPADDGNHPAGDGNHPYYASAMGKSPSALNGHSLNGRWKNGRRITAPGSAAMEGDPIAETNTIIETDKGEGTNKAAGQKGLPAWFYQPGLADQRLIPQVHASALNTKKSNAVTLAGLSHPHRSWEAGFVAGGGFSRLNQLNSDQAKAALAPSATSLYTIATNASPASNEQYISNVRPGVSFDGGIYLQRALSDRWIVNTGMNLHYYSNRISVGQQVTTYVQASSSYFIPTTTPTAVNTSIYSAGDTRSFVNKYYFLELPVGLQWKINKSRLLPIFVEGGVSLSRLMGASALFYDAKKGFYSKDGNIVNKTQFNLESALLVELPFHGVSIQMGPQIQYGLTPLVNTQGVGDQHLLYTGIRLVVIPGRK